MLPVIPDIQLDSVILGIVKTLFFAGFGLYLIFAVIALRQIGLMRKTVVTPLSPIVQLIGIAHLVLAIGALIFVILFLH